MNDEFQVEFFELESGNVPFLKFLNSLTKIERAEVLANIEEFRIIKSKNELVPSQLSKFLKDGIFELRVKHQTRITRSLYFF
ncbi:MAG: type II toxin-antitoxin system RelE/ParE family toxin [Candidatus Kapabacteria bacterium]|nr:type II toxin-antitoxin system RelE/ParE family toxin [Ignavibacteriota bacterium]MCW5884570.1 type II toxin-antitoxin system RelE/ParE family toxin [Candidatus Kapabacteria bacterium]